MPMSQAVSALAHTPRDFHVLSGLKYYLNSTEYTPLKQAYLARCLGLTQQSVSQSLKRLRRKQYLEWRLTDDGTRAYRLTEKAAA